MTENEKNIYLKKLIEGNISTEENRKLELEALDDPFLFDALEGINLVKGDHFKNTKELQEKIMKMSDDHKKVKIHKLDALVYLFLLSYLFISFYHGTHTSQKKIKNEIQEQKILPPMVDIYNQRKKIEQKITPKIKNTENIKTIIALKDSLHTMKNEIKIEANLHINDSTTDVVFAEISASTPTSPWVRTSIVRAAENREYPKILNPNKIILAGKIINKNGDPIIGATVISNENVVNTDIRGNFTLNVSTEKPFVIFTANDYESIGQIYDQSNLNIVHSLNKIEDKNDYSLFSEEVVSQNFENFNSTFNTKMEKYLKENKINFQEKITIFFQYEEDGSIQNVLILNSIDFRFRQFINNTLMSEKHLLPNAARGKLLTIEYESD